MKLDSIQEQIVTSTAKNIIVSAGAGSGKTRVLTERVKHLLRSGVSPEGIVCITFTNKAADEMKVRLSDVAGIGDAFIGTIHSFANRIFKNSGTKYDLLTSEKEIEIILSLIRKYGKYTSTDDYMKYIDLLKDVNLGIQEERESSRIHSDLVLSTRLEYSTLRKQESQRMNSILRICTLSASSRISSRSTSYSMNASSTMRLSVVSSTTS